MVTMDLKFCVNKTSLGRGKGARVGERSFSVHYLLKKIRRWGVLQKMGSAGEQVTFMYYVYANALVRTYAHIINVHKFLRCRPNVLLLKLWKKKKNSSRCCKRVHAKLLGRGKTVHVNCANGKIVHIFEQVIYASGRLK